jgi:hypothetical protein
VETSRRLNLPFKSDWNDYRSEEERAAFHVGLGARAGSDFLNLRVDAQVTWPAEPKRVQFAGHSFVLFPMTQTNAQSVSIDLAAEKLSAEQARTLLNRFLSLLCWCDEAHAILGDGWSGNSVPVPITRHLAGSSATSSWIFDRAIPTDEDLLQRLAYYREGLNAREKGLVTFEVLSFFKVFEHRSARNSGPNPTKAWISGVYGTVASSIAPEDLLRFDADRNGKAVEKYVYENCRVATAHTSADYPSDADASPEIQRLYSAAEIVHALARHFIKTRFNFSDLHYETGPVMP